MGFLVFLPAILGMVNMHARVVLPSLFTDNMVLQQQTDVQLWVMASPKKMGVIRPSRDRKLHTGRADDAVDMIVRAGPSRPIRICTIGQVGARRLQKNCRAQWLEGIPEAVSETGVTAYSFADYPRQVLDVPVGIIVPSWGGTNPGKGNTASAIYPAVDAQGNVYVALFEEAVAAYDNQCNGLWRYPANGTRDRIDPGGTAAGADGTVYAGTKNPDDLVVAPTEGGAKKRTYSPVAEIRTTPATDSDGNIHVCDNGGNHIILNADATEKYKRQSGPEIRSLPAMVLCVTYGDNDACKLTAIDCGIEGPANSPWHSADRMQKEMLYKNKKTCLKK